MKDKRAFAFYLIASIMLWQFGVVVSELCTDTFAQMVSSQNPFVSFIYAQNTGGAFSIFKGHTSLLSLFAVMVLGVLTVYVYKRVTFNDKYKILALVFFSAGILGNMYERITLGYVIDYIKLNFVDFAIFNVFDIMICLSVLIFILIILFEDITEICLKNGKNKN